MPANIIEKLKNSPIFRPNLLLKSSKKITKVYVGMCVHRNFTAKIFNLMRLLEACPDPKFEVQILSGDALIDRSRSRVATHFLLNRSDCDILMFLDDDIVFDPKDFQKLIKNMVMNDLDVFGATYVTKDPVKPSFTFKAWEYDEKPFVFGNGCAAREVAFLSTGCMAIQRRVLQSIIDKELVHFCHPDRYKFYPFFMPAEHKLSDGSWTYLSEDWAFCMRARTCGFKVFMDCSTKLQHMGDYAYDWNDLMRPPKVEAENFTAVSTKNGEAG